VPILGVASYSAAIHDVAAAAVNREADAHVVSPTGDALLDIGEGEHGIIVATNNPYQACFSGCDARILMLLSSAKACSAYLLLN
jgi:hypothetical protein